MYVRIANQFERMSVKAPLQEPFESSYACSEMILRLELIDRIEIKLRFLCTNASLRNCVSLLRDSCARTTGAQSALKAAYE